MAAVGFDSTLAEPSKRPIHMSIDEAHWKFGHGHEDAVWKAAKHLGSEIVCGTLKPCLAC